MTPYRRPHTVPYLPPSLSLFLLRLSLVFLVRFPAHRYTLSVMPLCNQHDHFLALSLFVTISRCGAAASTKIRSSPSSGSSRLGCFLRRQKMIVNSSIETRGSKKMGV